MATFTIRKVLLADDDADLRRLGKLSLGKIGKWQVLVAASGEAAIDLATREAPDVILMDVSMPGMDGRTTLQKLREDPRTAAIPVIFVTARALPDEVAALVSAGALGVITKPFDVMGLPGRITHLVAARYEGDVAEAPSFAPAEGLAAMKREYLATLRDRVDALAAAVARARKGEAPLDAARTLAHKLRGSAGSHGLAAVSEAAGFVEDALLAGDSGMPEPAWSTIDEALVTLRRGSA